MEYRCRRRASPSCIKIEFYIVCPFKRISDIRDIYSERYLFMVPFPLLNTACYESEGRPCPKDLEMRTILLYVVVCLTVLQKVKGKDFQNCRITKGVKKEVI